jgi:inosine/xanthosine triphosphate pyrophosphatase family protein
MINRRIIITESERLDILKQYKNPTFVTSNKLKRDEFKKYMPTIKITKGEDIEEVMGTKDDVIIYKAIDAGEGYVVEDTILNVNGLDVIDIKWKADELNETDKVIWVVSLGYNDGENISVYRGSVEGKIKNRTDGRKEYGFGLKFYPHGYDKPIDDIEKDMYYYGARRIAINNFKNKKPLYVVKIANVPPWNGKYQGQ